LDCDEVFKPEDIETVIRLLKTEQYTSVGFKSLTFYGGFDNYLTGFEENAEFMRIRKVYPGSYWKTHRPPTIAHIVDSIMPEKHLDFNFLADNYGVRMYHYSYVFPDQVFNKIKYYEEFLNKSHCIKDYFNQVYLPWVTGSEEQRKNIEQKYLGVHEWTPNSRGPCYSAPFTSEHPEIIQNNLHQLKNKFNRQLTGYLS